MPEAGNELPLDQRPWDGVPRHDVPWYPMVDAEACIGCTLCYVTCGRRVYDMADTKAVVANAYDCMVGGSTCAMVCPVRAIHFPDHELGWKVEREHKVFGDKRFLLQLEELVRDDPVDLIDVRLEVPTVKGLLEHTPAYMVFEVAALAREAPLSEVPGRIRTAVHKNHLVLVSETPL